MRILHSLKRLGRAKQTVDYKEVPTRRHGSLGRLCVFSLEDTLLPLTIGDSMPSLYMKNVKAQIPGSKYLFKELSSFASCWLSRCAPCRKGYRPGSEAREKREYIGLWVHTCKRLKGWGEVDWQCASEEVTLNKGSSQAVAPYPLIPTSPLEQLSRV